MIPMIMSVLYVWAQLNKDTIVTFWFGTQFKVSPVLPPTVTKSPIQVPYCWHHVKLWSVKPPHNVVSYFDYILWFSLLGALFALGHPDVQLCHRGIVSSPFSLHSIVNRVSLNGQFSFHNSNFPRGLWSWCCIWMFVGVVHYSESVTLLVF